MTSAYEPPESARQLLVAAMPIAAEDEDVRPDEAARTLRTLAAEATPETVECLAVAAAVMADMAARARVDGPATMRQLGAALQLWRQNQPGGS